MFGAPPLTKHAASLSHARGRACLPASPIPSIFFAVYSHFGPGKFPANWWTVAL